MSSRSALAFQPAPRPQPRTSPEDVARLQAATEDLGFSRPLAGPPAPAVEPPAPAPMPPALQPPAAASAPIVAIADVRKAPALKFDVPDALWDDLRLQALRRRVTVKYLVLEALAAKGYPVDLSSVPEDGRRIR